jgi:hypothetical protein
MGTTAATQLGNEHDALRVYYGDDVDCPCGCDKVERDRYVATGEDVGPTVIGRGEARTAWLVNGVVYKVGRAAVNEHEHRALGAWRQVGASWAPLTSLYRGVDCHGDTFTVLAMEYLPDDGSPPDESTLAEIRAAAPQTCPENWSTCEGRTYLIDGGDIELYPRYEN